MKATLQLRLGVLAVGVALLGCDAGDGQPEARTPPSAEPAAPATEPEAPSLSPAPAPVVAPSPVAEPEAPLSLLAAVGRSRDEIERAWGEPLSGGAWVRYADGRLIRYRDGVAESVQGRLADRDDDSSSRAEWLGVPDDVMAGCRRNLESWCIVEHESVTVEQRAGLIRLAASP